MFSPNRPIQLFQGMYIAREPPGARQSLELWMGYLGTPQHQSQRLGRQARFWGVFWIVERFR